MGRTKNSLCQTCFNFDCCWHKEFCPVPGWEAKPTLIHNDSRLDNSVDDCGAEYVESYLVTYCPLYKARGKNHFYLVPVEIICRLLNVSRRTFFRWQINVPKKKEFIKNLRQMGFEYFEGISEHERKNYYLKPITEKAENTYKAALLVASQK